MKFFISYTTRDKEITLEFLKQVSLIFQEVGDVFVDLIDNDSSDKQGRVFFELENSDYIVLIKSQNVNNSNWVTKELKKAEQLGIPTIKIDPGEIDLLTRNVLLSKLPGSLMLNNPDFSPV